MTTRLKNQTGTPPHTLTHSLLVQTEEGGGKKDKTLTQTLSAVSNEPQIHAKGFWGLFFLKSSFSFGF